MTTARSFLRFVLAGVMANVLAAACIVNSDNGDDDDNTSCEPNSYKDCTCDDGTASQRKCNASGTAYAACMCDGSSGGGSGNEGGSGSSAEAGTGNAAGKTSMPYGGETSTEGGAPTSNGGTPSEANGGAGGSGEVDPGICGGDEVDSCADCYQQGCCDQWTACAGDSTCLDEFLDIIADCSEIPRQDHNVTTAEFEQCVADKSAASGGWSSGLSPLTVDMVDCVAGDDADGWEGQGWGSLACKAGCFDECSVTDQQLGCP
jgi:hypothetical protein